MNPESKKKSIDGKGAGDNLPSFDELVEELPANALDEVVGGRRTDITITVTNETCAHTTV